MLVSLRFYQVLETISIFCEGLKEIKKRIMF